MPGTGKGVTEGGVSGLMGKGEHGVRAHGAGRAWCQGSWGRESMVSALMGQGEHGVSTHGAGRGWCQG